MMNDAIERILISKEDIEKRVDEIAGVLNEKYKGKEALLVCVLTGSFMFFADLVRRLNFPVEVNFLKVSSYGRSTVSGEFSVVFDLKCDIEGKNVIVVEDIIDSGNTILNIKNMLNNRNPAELSVCAFLDKPSRRTCDVFADYVGFEIPDEFVVGYGLDFNEQYRELPYVGILKRSVYE